MSGHEVVTLSCRYGAWAECRCGWISPSYRTRLGASKAWAGHMLGVARRRPKGAET